MNRSYDNLLEKHKHTTPTLSAMRDLKRAIITRHLLINVENHHDVWIDAKVHYYPITNNHADEKYILSCTEDILVDLLNDLFSDSGADVNFDWLEEYSTNNSKLVPQSNYNKYAEFHDKLNASIKLDGSHEDHWKIFKPFELKNDYVCGYLYNDRCWEITIFDDTNIRIVPVWYQDKVTYVVEILIDFFSDHVPALRTILNNLDLTIDVKRRD